MGIARVGSLFDPHHPPIVYFEFIHPVLNVVFAFKIIASSSHAIMNLLLNLLSNHFFIFSPHYMRNYLSFCFVLVQSEEFLSYVYTSQSVPLLSSYLVLRCLDPKRGLSVTFQRCGSWSAGNYG